MFARRLVQASEGFTVLIFIKLIIYYTKDDAQRLGKPGRPRARRDPLSTGADGVAALRRVDQGQEMIWPAR